MTKLLLASVLAVAIVGPAMAQGCGSQNCLDSMAQGCGSSSCVDSNKTKAPHAVVAAGNRNGAGGHTNSKKTTRADRPHHPVAAPRAGSVFTPDD